MMNDITDNLLTLLEGLHAREKQIDEIVCVLQQYSVCGPGILAKSIAELQCAIVKHQGGNRANFSACMEMGFNDPFYNFEERKITREELLEQIKMVIEMDLTPSKVLKANDALDNFFSRPVNSTNL